MRVRQTNLARSDVQALYAFSFQEFGERVADAYIGGLFDLYDLLAANPELARVRTDIEPPVRMHPYRSHNIIYRVEPDGVVIVRVLHSKRDWLRELDSPVRVPSSRER